MLDTLPGGDIRVVQFVITGRYAFLPDIFIGHKNINWQKAGVVFAGKFLRVMPVHVHEDRVYDDIKPQFELGLDQIKQDGYSRVPEREAGVLGYFTDDIVNAQEGPTQFTSEPVCERGFARAGQAREYDQFVHALPAKSAKSSRMTERKNGIAMSQASMSLPRDMK